MNEGKGAFFMFGKAKKSENPKKEKNPVLRQRIKVLAAAAMLAAMSVVIGIICKRFLTFSGGTVRITFENLPVIMSGLLFGPIIGAAVGLIADLLSCVFAGQAPFWLISIGAVSVGAVSGFVSKYIIRKDGILRIIISEVSAQLVGSVLIKTYALSVLMSKGFYVLLLSRLPVYALIVTIEAVLLAVLFKNRYFRKITGRFGK